MEKLLGKHWHHMPHEEVINLLETNPDKGLDLLEISHRKERFGANVLTAKKAKVP